MAGEPHLAELGVAHAQRHRVPPSALPTVHDVDEVLAGALAPAGRRHRRCHDVLDAVPGAHPTVVARCPPAVLDPAACERRLPVVPQEVLVQPGAQVIPRQDLVDGAMTEHVPVERETLGLHRLGPAIEVEALAPLLERPAGPPHPLDDPPDAPVPATGDALGDARRRVVPLELDVARLVCCATGRSCGAARRACSGRTTGTECAAWARTRPRSPSPTLVRCADVRS